jgi:hypothetical protein
MAQVKVGVQIGAQVVFGARNAKGLELAPNTTVSQVFVGAMNVGTLEGLKNAGLPTGRAKARLLLRAAYRGAYAAALAQGCERLYLSIIGGGQFGNNACDTLEEIFAAHSDLGRSALNRSLKLVRLVLLPNEPCYPQFISRIRSSQPPPGIRFKLYRDGVQFTEIDTTPSTIHIVAKDAKQQPRAPSPPPQPPTTAASKPPTPPRSPVAAVAKPPTPPPLPLPPSPTAKSAKERAMDALLAMGLNNVEYNQRLIEHWRAIATLMDKLKL